MIICEMETGKFNGCSEIIMITVDAVTTNSTILLQFSPAQDQLPIGWERILLNIGIGSWVQAKKQNAWLDEIRCNVNSLFYLFFFFLNTFYFITSSFSWNLTFGFVRVPERCKAFQIRCCSNNKVMTKVLLLQVCGVSCEFGFTFPNKVARLYSHSFTMSERLSLFVENVWVILFPLFCYNSLLFSLGKNHIRVWCQGSTNIWPYIV